MYFFSSKKASGYQRIHNEVVGITGNIAPVALVNELHRHGNAEPASLRECPAIAEKPIVPEHTILVIQFN